MNRDENRSNDEFDTLNIIDLGKQVTDFLEEEDKSQTEDQENSCESPNSEGNTIKFEFVSDSDEKNQTNINNSNRSDQSSEECTDDLLQSPEESSDELNDEQYLDDPNLDEINDSLASQVNSALGEDDAFSIHMSKKRKRKKIIIISASAVGVLILAVCFFAFTRAGRKAALRTIASPLYDQAFDYEDPNEPVPDNDIDNVNNNEVTPTPQLPVKVEDNVINILLIGVEEIEGAKNTDVMIIASLNQDTHELSIISLMRDLYVTIPGHNQNKLNAAFAMGGINSLYDTIEQNFGVHLDGYIKVNFEDFETIVDILKGVEVTLTKDEAAYLQVKNYISNKANRNVVEGTQIMNGNQALGYCRVRYVSTGKEIDDFGRTARHRAVLSAMYKKLMKKNVFELISFMNEVLAKVQLKTDITKAEFTDYLTEVVDLNISELKQYRIPTNKGYYNEEVKIGRLMQDVLKIKDWDETKKLLHGYIYGEEEDPNKESK